jgi:hypothetical protein
MSPQKRGIPIGSVVVAPFPIFGPNLCIMHVQSTFPKGIQSYEMSVGAMPEAGLPQEAYLAWTRLAWGCWSARSTSASTTVRTFYGYMRTADPIGTAYDRLLQSMQTYRSTQLSFFRGIGRSGRRTPSHSQHCS